MIAGIGVGIDVLYPVLMQYAMIIIEGAIDESIAELDGLTPLEAASTPNTDLIAQAGRVGLSAASPSGMRPTAVSALMSLLGVDPAQTDPAIGPLSALSRGVEPDPEDRVWRLSFLTAPNGVVMSPAVASLDAPEARAIVASVVAAWTAQAPDLAARFTTTSIDSTGCVLIERGGAGSEQVPPALPIDLLGARWQDGVPTDRQGSALARLIEIGAGALQSCDVNQARRSAGAPTIDVAWVWGGGATVEPGHGFAERFGLRGAILAEAEHAMGVGKLIGLDRILAPVGSDLEGLGSVFAGAMDRYEVVIAHLRQPADASLAGDAGSKVRAIEAIDEFIVGPALSRLDRLDRLGGSQLNERPDDGFRIMVAATAEVSCVDRVALDFPNLVTMGGTWMEGQVSRRLIERDATASDLKVEPGHEILEFFLRSGLHVQTRKSVRSKLAGGSTSE